MNKIEGKVFAFSGCLEHMTRNEAKASVEARGGRVTGTVREGVDFVVHGPGAARSKLTMARMLGIPCLTEQEFLALIISHTKKTA